MDNGVSAATQRGIDGATAAFRGLGSDIREVTLSPLQDWRACGFIISIVERAAAYEDRMRNSLGNFGDRLRNRLLTSLFATGVDYVQAVRRQREPCAEVALPWRMSTCC